MCMSLDYITTEGLGSTCNHPELKPEITYFIKINALKKERIRRHGLFPNVDMQSD